MLAVLAVGFFSLALVPRARPRKARERIIFAFLYALAFLLGLAFIWEIFYLSPRGSSFELITGISLYHHLLFAVLGAGGIAYLIILIIRSWRQHEPHSRQQTRILLAFTGLAIVPGVLLTLMPVVISDSFILPWIFFIALLSLIPAGYGYIIYRRKYLGLDLFVSRSLTLLLIALALLIVYGAVLSLLHQQTSLQALEPLPSYLALAIGFVVVLFAGRPSRKAINSLIYGPQVSYEETMARYTAMLVADPQISSLRRVFSELADLMQVRQAALMVIDKQDRLVCIESIRADVPQPVPLNKLISIPGTPIRRSHADARGATHFLDSYPWTELLLFLSVGDAIVGLILLGAPIPGGYFNSQQVNYIQQTGSIMAVAIEEIRLFESSREMSRELMVVREAERAQLAARIHDDSIHRITVAMNNLAALENRSGFTDVESLDNLRDLQQTLRGAVDQLREICSGLHSPVLDQSLQMAVRDAALNFERQAQMKVELNVEISDDLFVPYRIATAYYHVLIKALNNVQEHSMATVVRINLDCQNSHLLMVIADNGQGIDLTSYSLSALIRAHYFGVASMHDWAYLVRGELSIEKGKEAGTMVRISAPVDHDFDIAAAVE